MNNIQYKNQPNHPNSKMIHLKNFQPKLHLWLDWITYGKSCMILSANDNLKGYLVFTMR